METAAADDCTSTLQAFRKYFGTHWYDAAGSRWTVLEAELKRPPAFLDRHLPWRRVPVDLHFGPRAEADLAEALAIIVEILDSGNEFCDHLKTPAAELRTQFQDARATADLIRVASRA